MEPKDQQTLLLAIYEENAEQARHHEQLRERWTAMVAQVTGVVLGLLSVSKGAELDLYPALACVIAGFLSGLGVVGFAASWKHNERAHLHRARIGAVRSELAELSGVPLGSINCAAKCEHRKQYPKPNLIRLHWVWMSFHVLVTILGFTLLSYTLVSAVTGCLGFLVWLVPIGLLVVFLVLRAWPRSKDPKDSCCTPASSKVD